MTAPDTAAAPDTGPTNADTLYTDLTLPEGPPERPYVVVNMVSTVDGKIRIGHSPAAIGSPLDKLALRRIRAAADGLLHGAETLRLEDVRSRLPADWAAARERRGLSPHPRPVVISRGGDLPLDRRYFTEADPPAIVIVPADLPPERRAGLAGRVEVIAAGRGRPDLPVAFHLLRQRFGLRHLACEGGPTLNFSLIEAGLLDELFWTVAPKVTGGRADLSLVEGEGFPEGTWARLRLAAARWHEDELFLRYLIQSAGEESRGQTDG